MAPCHFRQLSRSDRIRSSRCRTYVRAKVPKKAGLSTASRSLRAKSKRYAASERFPESKMYAASERFPESKRYAASERFPESKMYAASERFPESKRYAASERFPESGSTRGHRAAKGLRAVSS